MLVHITGGKGFLGRYTRDALREQYKVEISDIDTLDVTNLAVTKEKMLASSPDVVCHLAGLTGANDSIADPNRFFQANLEGTLNVLEACRLAKVKYLVFMSTLTVHGAAGDNIDENSPFNPAHPYAGSKAAAEIAVRTYAANYDIKSAVLRATLIAGEDQKEPNAVTEFIDAVMNEGLIEIYGDGLHQREWLHPEDLARSVAAAVNYLVGASDVPHNTFIISSGVPLSMYELAQKIIGHLGRGRIKFTETNRQAFSLCSRSRRARELLEWQPEVDIEEIISRIARDQGYEGWQDND